jgi:hypothetical protein
MFSYVLWQHDIPANPQIQISRIPHFAARGLRRVYGRGDTLGGRRFNLDVWATLDGKLLARFWSRSLEVDEDSWEVSGAPSTLPYGDDDSVPQCLRERYNAWVAENY